MMSLLVAAPHGRRGRATLLISISDQPGLGINVDWDVVEQNLMT